MADVNLKPVVKCLKIHYNPNHTHLNKSHPRRMAKGHASHSQFTFYIYLILFPEQLIKSQLGL
ncbi:MAG: hypothetical protein KGH66_01950 [Candidatus Micrarchaeota archaeon]|nr:hypothetical protein [Candidatus Micrarchaeota archaeon]